MRRLFLTTLLMVLCFSRGVFAEEKIISFHADVRILKDKSFDVTETIQFRAEGETIKRGLYRTFPVESHNANEVIIKHPFEVISIKRDGINEPYHVKHETIDELHNVIVYIGKADVFLDKGEYEYKFRYTTNNWLLESEEQASFYWNVTGNEWAFPIEEASVTLHLPDGVEPQNENIRAWTGLIGETGQDWKINSQKANAITIKSSRSLKPKEGLSVDIRWDKD